MFLLKMEGLYKKLEVKLRAITPNSLHALARI